MSYFCRNMASRSVRCAPPEMITESTLSVLIFVHGNMAHSVYALKQDRKDQDQLWIRVHGAPGKRALCLCSTYMLQESEVRKQAFQPFRTSYTGIQCTRGIRSLQRSERQDRQAPGICWGSSAYGISDQVMIKCLNMLLGTEIDAFLDKGPSLQDQPKHLRLLEYLVEPRRTRSNMIWYRTPAQELG